MSKRFSPCLAPSVPLAPAFRKRRTTSGKRFLKLKRQHKDKGETKSGPTKLEIYINQSDLCILYIWSIYIYINELYYIILYMNYILVIYDDLCIMYSFLSFVVCVIFTLELYLYGHKTTPYPLTLPSKQLFSSRICIWSSAWQFWWQWHRWHQPWSLPFEVPGVTTRFTRQWGRYICMYRTEKFHMIWELSQVHRCMYQSFKQAFFNCWMY